MNIESKYLNRLKEEKILIDVYTDHFEESYYGFIVDYNEDFLVLEKFDDDSNPDGLTILFRENITRLRWGGNEITSVQRLIDDKRRIKQDSQLDITSVESVIKSIHEGFGYLTVHIQNIDQEVCFIGELLDIDSEKIVINEYGAKSTLDRKCIMLSISDITLVEGGGQYEENLKKLFEKE